MAPFLCNAIFSDKLTNPLELILLAKEAVTLALFNNVSAQDQATVLSIWAFAIHLG